MNITTWFYASLAFISIYGASRNYQHVTEQLLALIAVVQIVSLERSVKGK